MADNLGKGNPQDRSRINVNEEWELQYWSKKFGVSVEQLKDAVRSVGMKPSVVEEALKAKPKDDLNDKKDKDLFISNVQHHGSSSTRVDGLTSEPLSEANATIANDNRLGAIADQGPTNVEALASRDSLKREKITKALAQLISHRKDVAPFAIGLFGHWGSGKSSQIDFVKDILTKLEQPKIKIAEFNAWEHEKSDNLGAALAQTVVESLISEQSFVQRLCLTVRLAARRKSRVISAFSKDAAGIKATLLRVLYVGMPLLIPILAAALAAYGIFSNFRWNLAAEFGTLGVSIAAIWITIQTFISKNLTEWFKSLNSETRFNTLKLPDFSSKIGSFHEIHHTLKHLCALRLSGNSSEPDRGEYLLLIVDDLDRCSPQAVKQVFDAVRLVASIPRVITLVALDERIAYKAIEKHFDQFDSLGKATTQIARDYLAKIFQVAITLPAITPEISNAFIRSQLFGEPYLGALHESGIEEKSAMELYSSNNSKGEPLFFDVLEEEIDLFMKLSGIAGMSNPRQLWRLKQAWFLLKGMALTNGDNFEIVAPWMKALFCRELILQLNIEARTEIEHALSGNSFDENEMSEDLLLHIDKLKKIANDGGFSRWGLVDVVLLPAAS